MPRLTALSLSPKRCCTVSRNTKRATKKASVAPMLEENDANNKPCHKPNSASAAKDIMVAPGNDKAVTTTYSAKNALGTKIEWAPNQVLNFSCWALSWSNVKN